MLRTRSNLDTNLVIIDTNVFLHSITTQYERNPHITETEKDEILFFNTMYLLSGAYMERLIFPGSTVEIVFAMDLAPYWRTALLWDLGCQYKGKRNKAVQSHRDVVVNALKTKLYNYLLEQYNLPLFTLYKDRECDQFPLVGYEADDIAAGIIISAHSNYDHIYVITNDHDWLPFTQFSNVTWLNMQEGKPRVRDNVTALEWVKTCSETMKTKERSRYEFKTINCLWDFKAFFGDTSDNIPGDKKDKVFGRYSEFINLFNPSRGFECWLEPDFEQKFLSSKTKAHRILSMQKIYSLNNGVPLCMQPFNIESFY